MIVKDEDSYVEDEFKTLSTENLTTPPVKSEGKQFVIVKVCPIISHLDAESIPNNGPMHEVVLS